MYLFHNVWITNQLFQLVNKDMAYGYCTVTTKHITYSPGHLRAGSDNSMFTNDMRLGTDECM